MRRTVLPLLCILAATTGGYAADTNVMSPRDQRILMQANGATLRLTSARVVGIRPGTPLLYTLTAIGAKPLAITVGTLPTGLRFDPRTVIVSGVLSTPGTYPLTVTLRGPATTSTTSVSIVCGDTLALTPPLGWNSYDAYGDGINEAQFLANVAWFKEHLQPLGYDTVVIDFRWYDRLAKARTPVRQEVGTKNNEQDANGRLLPAPTRFPSAADGRGFSALAKRIHAQGLKFGIHIMRGISRDAVERDLPIAGSPFTAKAAANPKSTCSWSKDMYGVDGNSEAGKAWYRSLARQYADWGVDFIKADDLSEPYHGDEIAALSDGLRTSSRSIVLSLSPGETPLNQAQHVGDHAHLWRMSGDFWDEWNALDHAHRLFTNWAKTAITGPGRWPDGDMLPFGRISLGGSPVGDERQTRFSHDEQLLLMSLWSIAPAPLMIGASLEYPDPWTTAVLTNPEVLAINQDPAGKAGKRLADSVQGLALWTRELAHGDVALVVINGTDKSVTETLSWTLLGLNEARAVRDVWTGETRTADVLGLPVMVLSHGAMFFRCSPAQNSATPDQVLK